MVTIDDISMAAITLIRLGAVSVSDDARAQELSRLLHCNQKPWLNSDY
jgi:hypothetical protein